MNIGFHKNKAIDSSQYYYYVRILLKTFKISMYDSTLGYSQHTCIIYCSSHLQVVRDAIEDICSRLNIVDPVEMEEYTLFLRTSKKHFTFY